MDDQFYSLQMILEDMLEHPLMSTRYQRYTETLIPLIANEENQ